MVMLSGAGVEQSGTPAQSKHPYPKQSFEGERFDSARATNYPAFRVLESR
jgi:hypothetical protein